MLTALFKSAVLKLSHRHLHPGQHPTSEHSFLLRSRLHSYVLTQHPLVHLYSHEPLRGGRIIHHIIGEERRPAIAASSHYRFSHSLKSQGPVASETLETTKKTQTSALFNKVWLRNYSY